MKKIEMSVAGSRFQSRYCGVRKVQLVSCNRYDMSEPGPLSQIMQFMMPPCCEMN